MRRIINASRACRTRRDMAENEKGDGEERNQNENQFGPRRKFGTESVPQQMHDSGQHGTDGQTENDSFNSEMKSVATSRVRDEFRRVIHAAILLVVRNAPLVARALDFDGDRVIFLLRGRVLFLFKVRNRLHVFIFVIT